MANKSSSEFRGIRFETIAQLLSEADRLAAADRAGKLERCGNWTLGQTFGHLATWCGFAFDGAPLKVPFFIRWIVKLRKHHFLYKAMPRGVKIPRVKGGTLGLEEFSTDEGLRRLNQNFRRLQSECPTRPHMMFGVLTHEEWIAMNLRHAELHLGYVREKNEPSKA